MNMDDDSKRVTKIDELLVHHIEGMRKENQPRLTTAPSSKSIELLLQD
jgi:hypothetical protein